jgi:hypothetical protein
MAGKFRRIAVLGVTSLGTWAVVPVAPPPDDKVAAPSVQVAPARSPTPPGVGSRNEPRRSAV